MLLAADILLHILHSSVILFCLFAWIISQWRDLHFGLMVLISVSWFGFSLVSDFPLGYCFLTDWHWEIQDALGRPPRPASYTGYLAWIITGCEPGSWIDWVTVAGYLFGLTMSIYFKIAPAKTTGN